mmetsp:Transcript_5193/g.15887  ORF Transcript_5193/g.15887 Transcript_5193/m.15887 type:complete len:118 (+) Transcript_5193:1442-1795(+)
MVPLLSSLLLASSSLLPLVRPAQAPPRAGSARLTAAGDELRHCLSRARDARERASCFEAFSVEELLDDGELIFGDGQLANSRIDRIGAGLLQESRMASAGHNEQSLRKPMGGSGYLA